MLKFTEDHEWLKIEGDIATVGITGHAAEQLGEVVFVELPEVGASFAQGDGAAVVDPSRRPPMSMRRSVARSPKSMRRSVTTLKRSMKIRPVKPGSSKIRLTDASQTDSMMDDG